MLFRFKVASSNLKILYICHCMKSSFKYIILLVILSLVGIFLYQLFWLTDLYHSLQQQNREYIMQAIRNADHVELFGRADFISKKTNKQRETFSQADDHGGVALTTRFRDKDSTAAPVKVIERKAEHRYMNNASEEMKKILQNGTVRVGDDFSSLGELGLQMQRSLHEMIDTLLPINVVRFDSLLSANLREKQLDVRHFTEIRSEADSAVIASSVPAGFDLEGYDLYTWKYTTFHPRTFYVYVESTRMATLAGMSGILVSSLLILLILGLSFAYMIWFLIHQKTVEQLKDDFTHNVTHELKTPIAISYAAIESIIHYNLLDNRAKAEKYLHLCHEELERLGGMVEQILSISLQPEKEFRLQKEVVTVAGMIDKIVEQQKIKSSRPFRVRVDCRPTDLSLKADRMHLFNILSNIIENAIKYTSGEPEIEIEAAIVADNVVFRICDNGPGISAEHQTRLFDKFYRIPDQRRQAVKGYGIGLFYVRTMTEKHGGTVTVESTPGHGSCFIITLPQ